MKIKFDSNQDFQLDAVNAVVDVFNGQPLAQGRFEVRFDGVEGELLTDLGVGNRLVLEDQRLLNNVQRVQERNGVSPGEELDGRHFSVEMETGTGKTYVYLRTIYELERKYGFRKFIIVVPSVAIREGVQKSLEMTAKHFRDLYGNVPLDAWVYDSKQVSRLRQFAGSNQLQVLIINIDAFNKKTNNVIHHENDKLSGRKPIDFVQACNPIVIIDEPQNMESDQARAAIDSLNPLCTLRYSATHRNLYNLLYRLDPVRAYDLRLVKRIEIDAVLDDEQFNLPYVQVKSIKATKSKISARLEIDVQGKSGVSRRTVTVSKRGDDLHELSGERDLYAGYVVEEIDAGYGLVSFANGVTLDEGQTHGSRTDDLMRVQIHETVKEHLEKELAIEKQLPQGQRLKVLSLFFIDRVAHYAERDGKIRRWFEEAYAGLVAKPRYAPLRPPPVEEVHNGYFAESKGEPKDTTGKSKADDDAYALIMRDKERLLSREEPLRFIFSHSALREGWDNPNVFQICTLNETKSELKKRQEIGRGMRLPVLENGERCFEERVNRLTVVANESYEDFARSLQAEIEEECGVEFGDGRIKNKRERRQVRLREGWQLNPDFQQLWERLKHKTRYSVEYQTVALIDMAARNLRRLPAIEPPRIRVDRAALDLSDEGVTAERRALHDGPTPQYHPAIPDLLSYLQRETELTRAALAEILIASGRLGEIKANPQQFMEQAAHAIKRALHDLLIDGIKYERLAGVEWEMRLFEEREILAYLSRLVEVDHSIYDAIEFESDTERRFAKELDARTDIKLFLKLPGWFKVETPIGNYNPDWAIVKQPEGEDQKLYLVRETKATKEQLQLRGSEWQKIRCGTAHFQAVGVEFKTATSAGEV